MLLGMEVPIGAVNSPPGTLSGKDGAPEHHTLRHSLVRESTRGLDVALVHGNMGASYARVQ